MPVNDFLLKVIVNFLLVVVFFLLNVGIVRLTMMKILKVSKNRKNESFQVSFWVTLIAFVFSFFMEIPIVRLASIILLNLSFIAAIKYYYFLDLKKTAYSWLIWLAFYIIIGLIVSYFL